MIKKNCPCFGCYSNCKTTPGYCLIFCYFCKQMAKNNGLYFCWYCIDLNAADVDGRIVIAAIFFAIGLVGISLWIKDFIEQKKDAKFKDLIQEKGESEIEWMTRIEERVRAKVKAEIQQEQRRQNGKPQKRIF